MPQLVQPHYLHQSWRWLWPVGELSVVRLRALRVCNCLPYFCGSFCKGQYDRLHFYLLG